MSLLLVFLSGACKSGTSVVSLQPPKQAFMKDDYEKLLSRWTRYAQIIKQLDTTLRVHATFQSPEFIAAYTARWAHVFKLPWNEQQMMARRMNEEWQQWYPFVIAAATMDYDWNDFERKETVWRVTLENDKKDQLIATKLEVRKVINVTIRDFFPYVGRFHRVYDFHFPKTLPDGRPLVRSDTKKLLLRFTGPLGHAELIWRIQ